VSKTPARDPLAGHEDKARGPPATVCELGTKQTSAFDIHILPAFRHHDGGQQYAASTRAQHRFHELSTRSAVEAPS
jgi:hypothetical protein